MSTNTRCVAYERRNKDLDPQLVWRGKDVRDWSDPGSQDGASLIVHAPPVYIQEKIHPKVLIDDLRRQTEQAAAGHNIGAGWHVRGESVFTACGHVRQMPSKLENRRQPLG